MKRYVRWVLIALAFVWLAFVYASFYLVAQQRPLGAANVRAVGFLLLDLLAAGALILLGAGLGRRLCRWLGVCYHQAGEQIVLDSAVGLGVLSFVILGTGLLGWLTHWPMWLVLGGLVVLLLPDLVATVRAVGQLRMRPGPGLGLGVYLGGTLLLAALIALTPPLDWDGLFYHLTMPKLYIEQGRIAPATDIPHQHFPGLMEMLYLGAMLIKGDVAAKLLHFGYALLLGGVIYFLAERHIGEGLGWTVVVVYAAIPMVAVLSGWAYNDLALAFYQLAALYAMLNWFQEQAQGPPRWTWLVLAAIFCGLAMGLKYTSFVCPIILLGLLTWHLARRRVPRRDWARAAITFVAVAGIVAAPWYLRTLALTGNPVYPFAYRVFGGQSWDEWRAAWYARAGTGLGWDLRKLFLLPWTLTLGTLDMNFYDGRMGPLFLLGLPFLIAWYLRLYDRAVPRPPAVTYLGLFALGQYVFWMAGAIASRSLFQSRLLLPAFVALCGPLAYLFGRLRVLDTPHFSLRTVVGMSVVLVLAANLCFQFLAVLAIRPIPVLVGAESRDQFLTRNLQAHYAAMELVNERVPEDGRVLFLWEPRSYYSERAAQPDAILERWGWLLYQHKDDLNAVAYALREDGYTHLLFYRAGMEHRRREKLDPLTEKQFAEWDEFAMTYLQEEGRVGEAYSLYRWGDGS